MQKTKFPLRRSSRMRTGTPSQQTMYAIFSTRCEHAMISLETASSFLALLDSTDQFTFQTFADDPNRPTASWPTVLHGSFEEHSGQLASLNDAGAGIFVMVNAGDGLTRA